MTADRIAFERATDALLTRHDLKSQLRRRPAIALERIAYGGGATSWYSLAGPGSIPALIAALSPGSVLSLYFDARLSWSRLDDATRANLNATIQRDGDSVVARRTDDEILLDAMNVSSPEEVDELAAMLADEYVLIGPFPMPAAEGEDALTVTLPDSDGVVRAHPH